MELVGIFKAFYEKDASISDVSQEIPELHELAKDIEKETLEKFCIDPYSTDKQIYCITAAKPIDIVKRIDGYWVRFILIGDDIEHRQIIAIVKTMMCDVGYKDNIVQVYGVYSFTPNSHIFGMISNIHFSPMLMLIDENDLDVSKHELMNSVVRKHLDFWKDHFPKKINNNFKNIHVIDYNHYISERNYFECDFQNLFSYVVGPKDIS